MGMIGGLLTRAFTETTEEQIAAQRRKPAASGEIRELGRILEIRATDITPNPNQPRKHFASEELTALAKSISENGIIQPLTVRRSPNGFELVTGERRLRAAKLAGLKSVPCVVIRADTSRSAVLALIENIQRADLSCFEEAEAIAKLLESEEITREDLSVRLGWAQSTIANKLRLLKLTPEEQDIILKSGLTERHARALLKVTDTEKRKQVLAKAVKGGWTVSALENHILALEREELKKDSYKKRSVMLKDVRLFFNSVNKALEVMRMAGVEAEAKKVTHEDHIEYIIKIPRSGEEAEETSENGEAGEGSAD